MKDFTFIDLFAGIGGFRVGLEAIGGKCVFSAEINEHACKMYELNFGDNPKCDITTLNEKTIPNHDILCAGFPCQPFSIAGKQKGFEANRKKRRGYSHCAPHSQSPEQRKMIRFFHGVIFHAHFLFMILSISSSNVGIKRRAIVIIMASS